MTSSLSQEQANRAFWERDADDYQAVHGESLARAPMAWGVWRIPESTIGFVGDVRGTRVLELGCGAAQWSASLARAGARVVALDVSAAQLRHAQTRVDRRVALVHATGSVLPFADGAFDLVVSDHGAPQFCAPAPLLAEVFRVLRPGGRFVLCLESALHAATWNERKDRQSKRLHRPMLGTAPTTWAEGTTDTVLTDIAWLRAFTRAGFTIDDAVELVPPDDAQTTFADWVPMRWAQRWPAEVLWRLSRPPAYPNALFRDKN